MMQQKKAETSEDAKFQSSASELRELLHSLTRYFDACERHETQDGESIPSSYAQALMVMLDFQNRQMVPTLSDLVDLLDIDKSNVTRLCQRMSESGHVDLARDERDRRAKRIELTTSGEELAEFIQNASQERYEQVLSYFENSERQVLFENLMRLNASLARVI